jgi:nucleotide-binding universal stress UspA family protein
MAFKTILSVIGVGPSESDLQMAINLCRQAEAHLSVLALSIAPPPPTSEYAIELAEAWWRERQADAKHLEERVRDVNSLLGRIGLSGDVEGQYVERGRADDAAARRARYADLTLIGPDFAADVDLKKAVVEGALFESERPVLLVPDAAGATLRPKRVLLAWDSGLEASRAARDALPLLADADDVRITMVDPLSEDNGNGPEPGADVATYLARHRVRANVDRLPRSGQSVADVLRMHAVDMAAEMIVMGAYSHSRLRERVFGGVTRSIVEKPPLPVFMSR